MAIFNQRLFIVASTVMLVSIGYAHADHHVDDGVRQINQVSWDKSEEVPYQEINDWTIPENQANVVFVREGSDNSEKSANIVIDGQFHSSLQGGYYTQIMQCSGMHRITVNTFDMKINDLNSASELINLQQQKTHYFLVKVNDSTGQTQLVELNDEARLNALKNKFRQTHQISRVVTDCSSNNGASVPVYIPVEDSTTKDEVILTLPSIEPVPEVMDPIPETEAEVIIESKPATDPNSIIVINKPIKLGVLFDTNSSNVRPIYNKLVEDVADFMQKYPTTKTLIEGHTDSVGSAQYNMKLSQRRADSVKSLLVDLHGANPQRVTTQGYGESRPIEDNSTAEGRQINRRVVATISPQ